MKKIVFLLAIWSLGGNLVYGYSGGSGEPNNPYQISTAEDLLALAADANDYNKNFILTADINLAGYIFTTAVIAWDVNTTNSIFDGNLFTGVFNGANHKISNLTIKTNNAVNSYLGLFGLIANGGVVKNVCLINVSITDGGLSWDFGGLAGENRGNISNCSATGIVTGGDSPFTLGGLVGENWGTISNSYSKSAVSGGYGSWFLGG